MSEQELKFQNAQNLMSMGEYEEGVKLLRELGEYPLALKLLGYAYYNGDGVEEDHNKALEYFVSAYEHGDTNLGLYELIHELVCDNLSNYKKSKGNFKKEIEHNVNLLKFCLESITKEIQPYDDMAQFVTSTAFVTAFSNCCDIIKVLLTHQGINNDLSPRLLIIEGMKLGLTELEFIKDVLPCHDKITEEGDFGVSNDVSFSWSIMAMRMFLERVDEVINNKKDIIISAKSEDDLKNQEEDDDDFWR